MHIGESIEYTIIGRGGERTVRSTGPLTMITHKKNGNVKIRWNIGHSRNADVELKSEYAVEVLWTKAPTYTATWGLSVPD